jgi:hypothetical protein
VEEDTVEAVREEEDVAEEEEEEAVVRPVVAADGKPSSKQITYILPKRIQTDSHYAFTFFVSTDLEDVGAVAEEEEVAGKRCETETTHVRCCLFK